MATNLNEDDRASATRGPLDELVGYHLRRASGMFASDFTPAMEGTGLRQVLFGILSVIHANPGINQGSTGRLLGIQRANMVSLVNELHDAGLIDRQVAEDDRRAFALNVTAKGAAVLADALVRIRAHEDRLLAGLDAGERDRLLALLSRIARMDG